MREMLPTAAEGASAPFERALAALAYRQYGVVSRAQLRDLGLGDSGVTARVRRGGLVPVHRGVFAVGHSVLVMRGVWMAAVLAGGPHAVLSHAAAGALWELRASHAATIDITIPGVGGRRRRKDLRIHRARSLDGQTAIHDRIPVTTPARTVLDLAATLNPRAIERRLDQAETLRLTDVPTLVALAKDVTGHPGSPKLLQTLRRHEPGATLTRSELEERFLALCRAAGIPAPLCNHTVAGGDTVDFVFAHQRLLVETDSWRWHRSRKQFETDRRRDAAHAAAGWRTLRFTHDRITHHPREVAETVRAVLSQTQAA
jgi:Protein of unknown function (DUF559)